jgi:cellulose synthase/poly-beta-1,6-N-acetylglucosamine synthase-like glycosyltransferase
MASESSVLLVVFIVLVCALIFLLAVSALRGMLDAWRTPATDDDGALLDGADAAPSPVASEPLRFSVIVPAHRAQTVLAKTLTSLVASDHPGLQVVVVMGDEDPVRTASAETWAARHSCIDVVVDGNHPKTKARALNSGLPYCTGDVVGVLDGDDILAPDLLTRVEEEFRDEGVDVVQGGAQPMDFQSSWWAVQNCLDHFLEFRSRLRRRARRGFVSLSGSTVFVRRTALEAVQGWDASSLAEECDLGVRLSTAGTRVAAICEPDLATREEGAVSLVPLYRQLMRRNQGVLQALRSGHWRQLPTRRQRMLALNALAMPLLRAVVGVSVPLAVVAAFGLSNPSVAALLAFPAVAVLVMTVVAEVAALREFGHSFAVEVRPLDQVRLVWGFVPYQTMLTVAAIQAVWRNALGRGQSRATTRARAQSTVDATSTTTRAAPVTATAGVLRRLGSWGQRHRWSLVLGLPVIVLVGVVHAWGMYRSPGLSSDEATLTAQAWTLQHVGGFAHGIGWWFHPPLGWIQIAGWTWFTDAFGRAPYAIAAGREAMLVAALVTASLVFLLCRRLGVGRGFSLLAVAIYGLSPLSVAVTRTVQLDNVAVPWLLAAFVLALSPRRRLAAAVASGLCFAVAVLSAGTTLFLVVPWVWLQWQHADRRNRKFVMSMSVSAAGVALALYAMFALLRGQLLPADAHVSLVQALNSQLPGGSPNGGLFDSTSALSTIGQWRHFDPLLPVIGIAAAIAGGFIVRLRPIVAAFAIQLVTLLVHGGHPTPAYVITILPLTAVLVAAVVDWVAVHPVSEVVVERARHHAAAVRPAMVGGGLLLLILLAGTAVPAWGSSLHRQLTATPASAMGDAADWVAAHVNRGSRLVVDRTVWVDMVRAGFAPDHVIAYDELEQGRARQPIGWRDIDGLVLPEYLAPGGDQSTIRAALEHAALVASFGSEPEVINVWQVIHGTAKKATEPSALATAGSAAGTPPQVAGPPALGNLAPGPAITVPSQGGGTGLFPGLSTILFSLFHPPFGSTSAGLPVLFPVAVVSSPAGPVVAPPRPGPPTTLPPTTGPPTTGPPTTEPPTTLPPTTLPPTTEPPTTEPPTTEPPTTEPPTTEPPTTEPPTPTTEPAPPPTDPPPTDPPPTDPPNPQFARAG